MSWIESHQSLLTHRKTIRASSVLKVDRYKLIGHLHALWWWSLDNAKDHGELGTISDEELAEAAGWPVRTAKKFVDTLNDVGFLDRNSDGMALHNWWTYAGKLNAKRAADRARKNGSRGEVAGNSTGIPTEVAGKSQAPTYLPNQPGSPSEILTYQTDQPTTPTGPGGGVDLVALFAGFGSCNEHTGQVIDEAVEEYSADWVERAIRSAGKSAEGRPKWSYVDSILRRWKQEGKPDDDRVSQTRPGHSRGGAQSAAARGRTDWTDEDYAEAERYAAAARKD